MLDELLRGGATLFTKFPKIFPDSPLDLKMKRLMEKEKEEKRRKQKKKKVIKYPPPKKKKKKVIKYPPPKKKKKKIIKGLEVIEINIPPKKGNK
jgi:hypothetical protein